MPQKYAVKAANISRKKLKSKAKLIEWEARVHSRGIRDVPVEVSTMESRPKPRRKAGRQLKEESHGTLQGETAPQPIDVDETFWVEEPAIPAAEKRVRQLACPSPALPEQASHISHSTPTLKNLSPRLARTYAASSNLRAFRRQLHARAASLPRSSGGV